MDDSRKRSCTPSLPAPTDKKDGGTIFKHLSTRVSQAFLDLLNAESGKMSAALQNPANHERIKQAAKEAPAAIAQMLGGKNVGASGGYIGRGGAVSQSEAFRTLESPQAVADEMYSRGIPADFKPAEEAVREISDIEQVVREALKTVGLEEPALRKYDDELMREILEDANAGVAQLEEPSIRNRQVAGSTPAASSKSRLPLIVAAIVAFAIAIVATWYALARAQQQVLETPIPDLTLQECRTSTTRDTLTIVCDSTHVCPHGWHLHTILVKGLTNENLGELLGYGDANEVLNSCRLNSLGQVGWTQDGRHYEANMRVAK